MELVMLQHSKYTGKKKPLSSLVTEVTLPKGGVLADIIVRLWRQSNLVTSKQLNILQDCRGINLFNYMLINSIKNNQHIEAMLNKYLMSQLLQSAIIAEI
jgi:hypothetical protein